MKHYLKNICILLIAGILFFVGNGVNYVDYCCHSCKDANVLFYHSCNDIHHQHHVENENCCSNKKENEKEKTSNFISTAENNHSCDLTRYDIPEANDVPTKSSLQVVCWSLLRYVELIPSYNNSASLPKLFPSIGYLLDSGRSILSKICILII